MPKISPEELAFASNFSKTVVIPDFQTFKIPYPYVVGKILRFTALTRSRNAAEVKPRRSPGQGRYLETSVTALYYGDNDVPYLEVSAKNFGGLEIVVLFPSRVDGKWTLMTRYKNGNKLHTRGIVEFPQGL